MQSYQAAEHQVEKYEKRLQKRIYANQEKNATKRSSRYGHKTTDDVADALMDSLGTLNNLYHNGTLGSKR